MSVEVGQRVRLRIKKQAAYPNEANHDSREAVVEHISNGFWFPILVRVECDGYKPGLWVKDTECEVIE